MSRLAALCLSLLLMAGLATSAKAGVEDEMQGFIVDNTISHIGHDFYYYFADRCVPPAAWTSTWWYANARMPAGAAWSPWSSSVR